MIKSRSVRNERLAREDPRPVQQIYDKLTSSASTSLETAGHFLVWHQVQNIMDNSQAQKCPPHPETQ
ncbi:hypothetical protein T11_10572 [Trichinella zimbabwensis]|uniref:Uncharacterized protein n=1 Tax=Trichinella zimbabwensis TaxID=268475 RepID=A0A0V1I000_9BILA|nr:hypothetical protein T11_10572 [Trichinella zimbabwensis]